MQRANASSGRMPRRENITTKFFKIIHIGIIQEQQLALPNEFVTKHGTELPDVVTVTVPTGDSWTIKLRKAQGKMWLAGGWKDFVDHHSIHVGHVLFFSYNGQATFYVIICDMTAVEIDYPSKTKKSEEEIPAMKSQESERHGIGKQKTEIVQVDEASSRPGRTMTPYWSAKACSAKSLWVRRNSATEAAQNHESEHPSFLIVMQPSYVEDKFALNVPARFMTKYLGAQSRDITLRLPDGASSGTKWTARCVFYNPSVVKVYDLKEFAEDNSLNLYDICVFELRDTKTADFTIFVYRNKNDVGRGMPNVETEGHLRIPQLAKMPKKRTLLKEFPFQSHYPFFLIKLPPTYVKQSFLHLPTKFVMKHLPKKSMCARIKDSDGRSWFLNYKIEGSNACLSGGWESVVAEYKLREESVCAFEVIDGQNILLKMSILKL